MLFLYIVQHLSVGHRKPKGECHINHEKRSEDKESVELAQIVFPNALRSPRTVVIEPDYAHVAVSAMNTLHRHIEFTMVAEMSSLKQFLSLELGVDCDSWVTESHQEVGKIMGKTDEDGGYFS